MNECYADVHLHLQLLLSIYFKYDACLPVHTLETLVYPTLHGQVNDPLLFAHVEFC